MLAIPFWVYGIIAALIILTGLSNGLPSPQAEPEETEDPNIKKIRAVLDDHLGPLAEAIADALADD
jgi:hypothetical protein